MREENEFAAVTRIAVTCRDRPNELLSFAK